MNYKICTNCGKELPATNEFFYERNSGLFGVVAICKKCHSDNGRQYYQDNKEYVKTKTRNYRKTEKGREVKRKSDKKYKRSEASKASNRRWKQSEKGKISQRKSAIKTYYENQLYGVISSHIYQSLKENKGNRGCFDFLPYTLEELRVHLENLWQPGMSWENYGRYGWHLDHNKPKAAFNVDKLQEPDSEEFKECWSLENLQPLWAKENLSKAAKYKGIDFRLHEEENKS